MTLKYTNTISKNHEQKKFYKLSYSTILLLSQFVIKKNLIHLCQKINYVSDLLCYVHLMQSGDNKNIMIYHMFLLYYPRNLVNSVM